MRNSIIYFTTSIAISLAGVAFAGNIKSAKAYGYRGADAKKYDRFITRFSKKDCEWVKKQHTSAIKVAGVKAKGNGGQAVSRVINNQGKSGLGLLAQVGSNVVKDSALKRDAAAAVLNAKACK